MSPRPEKTSTSKSSAQKGVKRPRSPEASSEEEAAAAEEYRPERAAVQQYQPEGGSGEPWGHLASECRNPDCAFIEVALPVHDSDEDAGSEELGKRWRRRGWGHLESDCPEGHGACGCVPVMLSAACQEAKARARGKGRPRRDGAYQWPGHAFQKKPSTK